MNKPDKEKWIKIGKKLLFPSWIIVIPLVIISALLLVYSLGYENANPVIAYISYILSAYALTVFVAKLPPVIKKIKSGLYANKYSSRYLSEPHLRAKISLYAGCGINILYAVFKFSAGIYYKSTWLGAIALYYIILSLMRVGLLKRERELSKSNDEHYKRESGLKSYRFCGQLMFLLNVAVTAVVAHMIWKNKSYEYPGYLIYVFAAYTFYCFTMAVINMFKYKKMEHPVLSAAKMLSFACALISILTLQTAMLTQFGEGDENFAALMNVLTGVTVCILVLAMAVWMVIKANRELAKLKEI